MIASLLSKLTNHPRGAARFVLDTKRQCNNAATVEFGTEGTCTGRTAGSDACGTIDCRRAGVSGGPLTGGRYLGSFVPRCIRSLLFSRQTYSYRSQPGRNGTRKFVVHGLVYICG